MRVLIIEPRSRAGGLICRALTANPAFIAQVVSTMEQEMHLLSRGAFDAVIIDAPLEWARTSIVHLRQMNWSFPVLVVDTAADKASIVSLIDGGADDYLSWPWEEEELASRVIALIRRSRGYATSCLPVGDLTLDLNCGRVLRSGVPLDLSPDEYRLLEYLVLRRGQKISALELAEGLFASDPASGIARVEHAVATISTKAGADSGLAIETSDSHEYMIFC